MILTHVLFTCLGATQFSQDRRSHDQDEKSFDDGHSKRINHGRDGGGKRPNPFIWEREGLQHENSGVNKADEPEQIEMAEKSNTEEIETIEGPKWPFALPQPSKGSSSASASKEDQNKRTTSISSLGVTNNPFAAALKGKTQLAPKVTAENPFVVALQGMRKPPDMQKQASSSNLFVKQATFPKEGSRGEYKPVFFIVCEESQRRYHLFNSPRLELLTLFKKLAVV